jgi:GLPGLI family protein
MKTLIFLLLINFTFAQNFGGVATYNLQVSHDEKLDKLPQYKDIFQKIEDQANDLSFSLNFNTLYSLFGVTEISDKKKAHTYAVSRNLVFSDFSENTSYYNSSGSLMLSEKENEFLIKDTANRNWQLTQETKVIAGYTCFKATSSYELDNKFKDLIIVTAWYCPTINYTAGPNGFFGLPGLILELHNRNTIFGLQKLTFNEKEVLLEKPNQGKLISKEDYWKAQKEKHEELSQELKRTEKN